MHDQVGENTEIRLLHEAVLKNETFRKGDLRALVFNKEVVVVLENLGDDG